MFKTLSTRVRGATAAAEGGVVAHNALLTLDQNPGGLLVEIERAK
jgi:hypothetical protein